MKRRMIGKTDLSVSEICLGSMYFGWREPEEQSLERLDQFVEAGGNFIDTANIYAMHHLNDRDYFGKDRNLFIDGGSERLLGAWMKEKKNRNQLILATKLGFPYPGTEYGTSAVQIKEECEKSLKRLGTDYVDILYLHTDDRDTTLEESLTALGELVAEGKVRYIGASNFTAWRLAQAMEISRERNLPQYCCIQQRCTYLRPRAGTDFGGQISVNEDMMDFVRESGITLLAYSPLLGGYYNDRTKPLMEQYQGADTQKRMEVLDEVAAESGASPAQLVYYWLMHSDPSVLPLVASSSRKQFEEALGALELKLSKGQMDRLTKAGY